MAMSRTRRGGGEGEGRSCALKPTRYAVFLLPCTPTLTLILVKSARSSGANYLPPFCRIPKCGSGHGIKQQSVRLA